MPSRHGIVDSAKRFSLLRSLRSTSAALMPRWLHHQAASAQQSHGQCCYSVTLFSAAKSHVLISRRYDYQSLSFCVTKSARLIYGGVVASVPRTGQKSRFQRRQPYKFPEQALALAPHRRLSSHSRLKIGRGSRIKRVLAIPEDRMKYPLSYMSFPWPLYRPPCDWAVV